MGLQTRLRTCAAILCARKVVERLAKCSSANRPASRGALLRFMRGQKQIRAHVLNADDVAEFLIQEGVENQDMLQQAQVILKACNTDPHNTANLDEHPEAKKRLLHSAKQANISASSLESLVTWILSQSHIVISVSSNAILERLLVHECVQESIDEHLDYHLSLDKLMSLDAWLFTERSLPPDALPKRKARDIFEMHLPPSEMPPAPTCIAEASAQSFEDLGLNEVLVESLRWHGLWNPSRIQLHCMLPLLQGSDVVAQARCGTGKTTTFAIAAIQRIDHTLYERLEEQPRCPAGHCFKKVFSHESSPVWAGCSCAGCRSPKIQPHSPKAGDEIKDPCAVCGCTSEFDIYGDRICWCDSCWHGCIPESKFDSEDKHMQNELQYEKGVHCAKCSWYLCRGCHMHQADTLLQQIAIPKCQVMIVVPTRELANQIHQTVVGLGRRLGIRCHACIGGTSVRDDINALRRGQHIVVGNPGRLFDMIGKRHLKVDGLKLFIMDEWDALASKNMKDQIYDIFKCLPADVQCGVFSTAMPSDVLKMTTKFMHDPVNILTQDHLLMPAQVRHFYMVGFDGECKVNRLLGLRGFVNCHPGVMVFCNSRKEVDFLVENIVNAGLEARSLHAELDQRERDLVMKEFRKRTTKVLVCTNEFGRGLNLPHVRLVVNYDMPVSADDYLLRSGRCGRFGRCGSVITFVSKKDLVNMKDIANYHRMRIEATSMEALYETLPKRSEDKVLAGSTTQIDTESTSS